MLFASFDPALQGSDDGPANVGLLGATRGTAKLVARASMRLESKGRVPPPKQILQLITGRTGMINLRAFGVVDLDAVGERHAGIDTAVAGGTVVSTAGRAKPKQWPEPDNYERVHNIINGLDIALEDAPDIMRAGIDRLSEALLVRHNRNPGAMTWPRLYRAVVKICQKRAKLMQKAEIEETGLMILPWDEFDFETEIELGLDAAIHKPAPSCHAFTSIGRTKRISSPSGSIVAAPITSAPLPWPTTLSRPTPVAFSMSGATRSGLAARSNSMRSPSSTTKPSAKRPPPSELSLTLSPRPHPQPSPSPSP